MTNLLRAFRPLASDFLSTLVFIGLYVAMADFLTPAARLYVATAAGIAAGLLQVAYFRWRRRPIATMQWASVGLVVAFGSATLLTRDPRFIMVKPSLVAAAIGAVMLQRDWMVRYLPPVVLDNVSLRLPLVWGYVWSAAFFASAAANLVVALACEPKTWAWFAAFVPLSVKLALFLTQYIQLRHAVAVAFRTRTAPATP